MNAYSVAAEMLGGLELSPDQRAQLRAIDYRYQLEVQRRLQGRAGRGTISGPGSSRNPPEPAGLDAADETALRALLRADIRDMLSPAQRAALDP